MKITSTAPQTLQNRRQNPTANFKGTWAISPNMMDKADSIQRYGIEPIIAKAKETRLDGVLKIFGKNVVQCPDEFDKAIFDIVEAGQLIINRVDEEWQKSLDENEPSEIQVHNFQTP